MEKNDPIIEEIFADLNFVIQNKIIALIMEGKKLKDGERYENYEER